MVKKRLISLFVLILVSISTITIMFAAIMYIIPMIILAFMNDGNVVEKYNTIFYINLLLIPIIQILFIVFVFIALKRHWSYKRLIIILICEIISLVITFFTPIGKDITPLPLSSPWLDILPTEQITSTFNVYGFTLTKVTEPFYYR